MKDYFFDYLTPQEQKNFEAAMDRGREIYKEIKKLERERSKNTRKTVRLLEVANKRMEIRVAEVKQSNDD